MTEKELKQIFHINNELRMWQEERQRLEDRIGGSGKWIDGMPRGTDTSDKVGNLATELANCKMMISCKEFELQMQKNRAIRYIDGIADSLLRQIVFYRCVCCMKWGDVAAAVGGKHTAGSTKKAYYRYFKKEKEDENKRDQEKNENGIA